MASLTARRLLGEAESTPPPSSIGADWLKDLDEKAKAILADGNVDALEIQATALLIPDCKVGDAEYTERAATWEESQNPNLDGNWEIVHFDGLPVTAYTLYTRRAGHGASSLSDHKTHDEAVREGNALSALLGVPLIDFSPEPQISENYGSDFVQALVGKAIQPYLNIEFLDAEGGELQIPLRWQQRVYTQGGTWHPGLVCDPEPGQLATIGGKAGESGGEFAIEVIHNCRFEGDTLSGTIMTDPEDRANCERDTPHMCCRPLRYAYRNEGSPPETFAQ